MRVPRNHEMSRTQVPDGKDFRILRGHRVYIIKQGFEDNRQEVVFQLVIWSGANTSPIARTQNVTECLTAPANWLLL